MILSFNEIEATILRAARGAGMEWGLAEEAANAARWLAVAGVSFEAVFLHVFEVAPWRADIAFQRGTFRPEDPHAWLCPIRAGACLSDLADILPLRVERVLSPLLLLPFAARLGRAIVLSWNRVELRLPDPNMVALSGATHGRFADRAEIAESTASEPAEMAAISPREGGVKIHMTAWQKLRAFEARTYVPGSQRSRLFGAGAGRIDND